MSKIQKFFLLLFFGMLSFGIIRTMLNEKSHSSKSEFSIDKDENIKDKEEPNYKYSVLESEGYDYAGQKRTKYLLVIDNSQFKTIEETEKAYMEISNYLKEQSSSKEVFTIFFNDAIQASSNCWQLGRICISDIDSSKNEVKIRKLKKYSLEELEEKNGFRVQESDKEGNILPPTQKEAQLYAFVENLLNTTSLKDDEVFQKTAKQFDISKEKAKKIYLKLMYVSFL